MANNIVYQQFPMTSTGPHSSQVDSSSSNASLGFGLSGVPGMQQAKEAEPLVNSAEVMQSSNISKRKNPMEPLSINHVPQESFMPNKRFAPMGHRSVLQEASSPNNRPAQMQSKSSTPKSQRLPVLSKRGTQSECRSGKSGSQQLSVTKNQTKMQASPRVQTDSNESVRTKMRESLAGALSLVSRTSEKPTSAGQSSQSDVIASSMQSENIHLGEPEILTSKKDAPVPDGHGQLETPSNVNAGQTLQTLNFGSNKYEPCHDEDISFAEEFFVKDELLQGNGLSWVLDPYPEDAVKINSNENHNFDQEEMKNQRNEDHQSAEGLAFKIEAELYKLYGGVNKKYKEKGRSLLFNLKDRNNPELRKRVVSGDIPPDRLCSMTAEELASKELSQWRIAKAEELAQMVVLPDTEVDVRRLVKKTHKGEYQVEVEQVDGDSIEIPLKTSSVTPLQSKAQEAASSASKSEESKDGVDVTGKKSKVENQEELCTITIPPSEGSDLMQGLMVDDATKGTGNLPSIVSLDEFMQSLDSEPPFENISAETTPIVSDRDDSDRSDCKGGNASSKDHGTRKFHPVGLTSDKPKEANALKHVDNRNAVIKDRTSLVPLGERIWEGSVQLNITDSSSVIGIFKCGEKTPTKQWPTLLEVKGRVRLDAFEKFLQELPMSRSRAVMVAYFVCKAESSESERASLLEAVNSYIMDERVGFAEPGPGTELYLCPSNMKTLELLEKILSKVHMQELSVIDNGLIGIIVWRKFTSTVSPNSSHSKHGSKRQHSSRRQKEIDVKMDVNLTPTYKTSTSMEQLHSIPKPLPNDEDDADVPPGFGPPAAKDDDLPEFDFSSSSGQQQHSNLNPSEGLGLASTRAHQVPSAERMRELVHKYGQTKFDVPSGGLRGKKGVIGGFQSWTDDDDDDDIPEWQPQVPHQQSMFRPHLTSNQRIPVSMGTSPILSVQPLQPPIMNMDPQSMHRSLPQGPWGVHPSVSHGVRPSTGQFARLPPQGLGQPGRWPRDTPGRGF